MLRSACAVLAVACFAESASAQALPPTTPDTAAVATANPADPNACGAEAALYRAGKIQVWVTRKGSIRADNPLRPLSPERHMVLQVVVNGRSATAYGLDYEDMRQGAAPARLEELNGYPIAWDRTPGGFPQQFRVVSEEGRVLLGPLLFESCGKAPAASAERPARAPQARARRGEGRRENEGGGNRPGLPQGAIPSDGQGGGLSLPKP